jgi:hypothetical protein
MKFERARKLFASFFGREPRRGEIVEVRGTRDTGLVIGKLEGVIYSTNDGERFEHRFSKKARPLLIVSADGRQIYVLTGAYRFTDRGFEG